MSDYLRYWYAHELAWLAAYRLRFGLLEDIGYGPTVLGNMSIRLEADMLRIKDLLGRMDTRIAHLEKEAP